MVKWWFSGDALKVKLWCRCGAVVVYWCSGIAVVVAYVGEVVLQYSTITVLARLQALTDLV